MYVFFFCGGVICFLRLFEVISDILKTYELYFPNIYPKIIDLIFEILDTLFFGNIYFCLLMPCDCMNCFFLKIKLRNDYLMKQDVHAQ